MTAQLDAELIHVEKLQQHQPAYLYAVQAHVYFNVTYPDEITGMSFHVESSALVVQYQGRVVGIMVYSIIEQWNAAFVDVAFIDEAYRGQGWYRRMWDELVKLARDKKLSCIRGGTAVDNHKMQEVMRHLNRVPTGIYYNYKL